MKKYDRKNPLIVIHIPKAAGTSSQQIFKSWFKSNFHRHYFNEPKGLMPIKLDLEILHTCESPVVLHGHFNKLRGFGVEDYYPTIDQFITIIRDPFELLISHYFYVRKVGNAWKDKSRLPGADLEHYLKVTKPNMLNHFPRVMNLNNYKDILEEYFIEIGITEYLQESMARIGYKLGFEFNPADLGVLNVTKRDQDVSIAFRDQFIELNRLEFEVYEYALSKYIEL